MFKGMYGIVIEIFVCLVYGLREGSLGMDVFKVGYGRRRFMIA